MDDKRYLLGWVPTKVGDSDKGGPSSGRAPLCPTSSTSGRTAPGCAMPDTVRAAFVEGENLEDVTLAASPARQEKVLREDGEGTSSSWSWT